MTEGKILTKHPSGKTGRNIDRQKYEPVKRAIQDRKSTRLNSSHSQISYAVFCLKKKKEDRCRSRQRPHPNPSQIPPPQPPPHTHPYRIPPPRPPPAHTLSGGTMRQLLRRNDRQR